MENFIFQNPTKLIFGKGMIGQLAKEIPAGKRILVTFGGGSVRKNGVYDQVKEALKGFEVTEFWGIEANPKIETLRKAIELGKEKKVDYLLAVGGGSLKVLFLNLADNSGWFGDRRYEADFCRYFV